MIVINLFGVPSAGKSTGAAYIFSKLKMLGVNAELITEFAKDKVWEKSEEVFNNQVYIFGKQSFKISRVKDKVDVVITDSPLPLSVFYNSDKVLGEEFNQLVMNVFNSYDNVNYLLLRDKPYNPVGRFQTEEQSNALAEPMKNLLINNGIKYTEKLGNVNDYDLIVSEIYELLNAKQR
jgi:hypothetical protein